MSNQEHLYDVLAPIFERRPAIWWLRSMERSGIPAGIEHDFETFRHHVQIVENGMIAEVTTPWGVTAVGGLTWHFTQTPCEVTPPPRPGGDTDAVLATIAELERSC